MKSASIAIGFRTEQRAGAGLRLGPTGLTLMVLAWLCLILSPAAADIRVVTASPGEDCSTQMRIGWHADLDEVDCKVVYTEMADAAWAQARTVAGTSERSEVFDGIDSKLSDGKDWKEEAIFLNYGVALTGLKPDTEYMYRITGGDEASANVVRHFKTAGASEFSFLWISDSHIYTPIPSRLRNMNSAIEAGLRLEPSVDFVHRLPGMSIAWGTQLLVLKARDLFKQPFAANYMFADVIGNHDWMKRRDGGSNDFFAVTHNNPPNGYAGEVGVCYWFIYGDVLFITLNNETMKTSAEALAEAKAWAAGVIEQQQGRYKRIFIAQHYQWFDGRNGRSSWYEQWKEFCDEHQVTLALGGNNHVYQRTHALRGDQVVEPGHGTVYMVAPSSDGERGVKAGPLTHNADKLALTYSSQTHSGESSVKTIGCVVVDVGPNSIRTRLVYLDDDRQVHVEDDTTFSTRPSDAPRAEALPAK
ncbi:MAG: metallophosphoesterase family protein [Candidatus Sumerlaeia bacterium]|nr:metallophosphoesterase family protein [Candidatus Sumerlaeia bacterium]